MKNASKISFMFVSLCAALFLLDLAIAPGQAKHTEDENQNVAVIMGEAGERYPIYGAGGIKVSGGHHGFWMSNAKTSAIEIDGSGISSVSSPQGFLPLVKNSDFTATPSSAHFVAQTTTCTLPAAETSAGKEIVVCNVSDGTTITYLTTNGEKLLGAAQYSNSVAGKVDRFISDGIRWYKE